VNRLLTKNLPEAPGKEIEVITVNYAPAAVDAIHRHDAHAVVDSRWTNFCGSTH
jgi:hypothetical protein